MMNLSRSFLIPLLLLTHGLQAAQRPIDVQLHADTVRCYAKIFHGAKDLLQVNVEETQKELATKLRNRTLVDPNQTDGAGRTLLHYGAMKNDVNLVQLLLQDPRVERCVCDKAGNKPSDLAKRNNAQGVLALLLPTSDQGTYIAPDVRSITTPDLSTLVPVCTFKTFHVSRKSYKPERWRGGQDLAGIVLYLYQGKQDWWLNGVHCRSGYIILKRSADIEAIKRDSIAEEGIVHGKVYRSVFGTKIDTEQVVGGGFSYYENKWKFNSFIMNSPFGEDRYHNDSNAMNRQEKACIKAALKRWIETGNPNYKSERPLTIFGDTRFGDPLPNIAIKDSPQLKPACTVDTFHVACRSSYIPDQWEGNEHLAGIVLYLYQGKQDWWLNDVHCRSGYIILKRFEAIAKDSSKRIYRSVFGRELNCAQVVGGGFAYHNKKWTFNSWTMRSSNSNEAMTQQEETAIKAAIKHWIATGEQNYELDQPLTIFAKIDPTEPRFNQRSLSADTLDSMRYIPPVPVAATQAKPAVHTSTVSFLG